MSARSSKRGLGRLRRVLRECDERGRTAIPVLGHGVNVQATSHRGERHTDAWTEALRRIWKDVGVGPRVLSRMSGSQQAQWEALRRAWSAKRSLEEGWEAEFSLKTRLCGELSGYETKAQQDEPYATLLCGFENILWCNVDRLLELAAHRLGLREDLGSFSWQYTTEYKALRSDITYPDGARGRIWYPHGNTLTPDYLRLGMNSHALTIHDFEALRSELMNKWRDGDGLAPPAEFYAHRRRWTQNWVDLFFTGPLVFIGTSLSSDDWPLWWLLHQRARNFMAFAPAERPRTYVLAAASDRLFHLEGSPADIELVEFASHDELWDFVFAAL